MAARWYDPRSGERHPLPLVEVAPWKTTTFIPLDERDWVLGLESS